MAVDDKAGKKTYGSMTREEYDSLRDPEVARMKKEIADDESEAQRQKRLYIAARAKERQQGK